ncbi:hypothetical protein ACH5RR_001713 [Cinchona calisaya]|uniref:F-box domain-containing protein n=1 Tax=Cinchona calisaya TaxID=153742 RepID=A0ABD3B5E8_9GENT
METILSCFSWLRNIALALTRRRVPYKHLPDEILLQIFTKLPAKSVIRCRCVCQRWKALTSTPGFLELHQKNNNMNRSIIVNQWESHRCFNRNISISFECSSIYKVRDESDDCPILKSSYPHKFLYSSSGFLIVLEEFPTNTGSQHYILLNPATGQKVRLITPPGSIYGIFFDPLVKDHHQYCVLWGEQSSSRYKLLVLGGSEESQTKTSSSRELHNDDVVDGPVSWQPRLGTPPVIVNDTLYWMVGCRYATSKLGTLPEGTRLVHSCKQSIMAFNTQTEKFSATSHPGPQDQWCKEDPKHLRMHLLEMDDHGILCLCECAKLEPLINIWIYENSRSLWIRRHAVNLDIDVRHLPSSKIRPVAFINGEVYAQWPIGAHGWGGLYAFNLMLNGTTTKAKRRYFDRRLEMMREEDEKSVIIITDVKKALDCAVDQQLVVKQNLGTLQLYIGKNEKLWNCINHEDCNLKQYHKATWDQIRKFLSSSSGRSAILATECRHEAAIVIKTTCLKELALGEILRILYMVINMKRWITHHQSGWQPVKIVLAETNPDSGWAAAS